MAVERVKLRGQSLKLAGIGPHAIDKPEQVAGEIRGVPQGGAVEISRRRGFDPLAPGELRRFPPLGVQPLLDSAGETIPPDRVV